MRDRVPYDRFAHKQVENVLPKTPWIVFFSVFEKVKGKDLVKKGPCASCQCEVMIKVVLQIIINILKLSLCSLEPCYGDKMPIPFWVQEAE